MKKIIPAILAIVLLLCACGQKAPTWQEQYDLGVRYLSEGSYEEAIIAFTAAIEIDPKKPETYLELAYVYIGQNDFDTAVEILKQGYELTQDERLKTKLDEIEQGNISDYWGNIRKMSTYDETGALIWYHIYDYTPDGSRQTAATSYDASGTQTSRIDILYDNEGRRLTAYHYRGDIGAIGKIMYEYDAEGNVVKNLWYQYETGELYQYDVCQYNEQGNLTREDQYSANGEHESYDLYFYNADGKHERQEHYHADGTLFYYQVWTYHEDGKTDEYCDYSADGTMSSRWVYRYDENGNELGYDEYDGEGNLTYSTVYN